MNTGPGEKGAGGPNLQTMAALQWPTPTSRVSNDQESPESFNARRAKLLREGKNGNGCGMPLTQYAQQWKTPRASKTSGGVREDFTETLLDQASAFHLDPESQQDGQNFSIDDQASLPLSPVKRRLNWRFVQSLMGFPDGWL
jgi:hypothetical protein